MKPMTPKILTALIMVVLCVNAVAVAQSDQRTISIVIEKQKSDIYDLALIDRLVEKLSMQMNLKVIVSAEDSTLPTPPNERFNLERLLEWGHECGSRYLIYLRLDNREIVTRKRTSIPYILNRYIVEGQVDGMFSFIDLNRGKIISTWKLKTRISGPRQWQLAEDYPDDPDLHMSAPQKIRFLRKLEDKAASEIVTEIKPHLRGR
ncbi:MAG: hypothetical protein V3V99_05580 [candidate division Zixibacteria bacterium]